MSKLSLIEANEYLKNGRVIAYPTEAVFGLGCDPDNESAVLALLQLKKRPIEKGLILIAENLAQLHPYIDLSTVTINQKQKMLDSWPGPITWIVPKNSNAPYFLTGKFNSIAIRITAHPQVRQLCQLFNKPIVSTSANLSNFQPCRTIEEVEHQFGINFPILDGKTEGRTNPSEIKDIFTNHIIRQG